MLTNIQVSLIVTSRRISHCLEPLDEKKRTSPVAIQQPLCTWTLEHAGKIRYERVVQSLLRHCSFQRLFSSKLCKPLPDKHHVPQPAPPLAQPGNCKRRSKYKLRLNSSRRKTTIQPATAVN